MSFVKMIMDAMYEEIDHRVHDDERVKAAIEEFDQFAKGTDTAKELHGVVMAIVTKVTDAAYRAGMADGARLQLELLEAGSTHE